MEMPGQKLKDGMNIAPDGTIYEILDDGTIKRIGKVSPDGKLKPFGKPGIWICLQCGTENSAENKYCRKCGRQEVSEEIILDPGNYTDKGDYIELVRRVGNIRMIEKNCFSGSMTWDQAMRYAENLRKGGFSDWRVPTKEELVIIYKIKNICGINRKDDWFWSSSVRSDLTGYAWNVGFYYGDVYYGNKTNKFNVRCVR